MTVQLPSIVAETEYCVVTCGDTVLTENLDYTIKYKNNKKLTAAGDSKQPTAILTGKGNYSFRLELPFTIEQKSLSDSDITVYAPDTYYNYRIDAHPLSKPIVKDGTGKVLKEGRDYTILGYENMDITTIEQIGNYDKIVKIQGMGNYTGETKGYYSESWYPISRTRVYIPAFEYNGDRITLTDKMFRVNDVLVYDPVAKDYLTPDINFVITDYKKNTATGTAQMTIRGCGMYGGQKKVTFKIVKNDLSK